MNRYKKITVNVLLCSGLMCFSHVVKSMEMTISQVEKEDSEDVLQKVELLIKN